MQFSNVSCLGFSSVLLGITMILSIKSHIDRFLAKGILSNVNPRELDNSEGVGLDISIGEVYGIDDSICMLGNSFRKTPEAEMIPFNEKGLLFIEPKKQYLIKTKESFNLPDDICCQFYPRSTLFRSGIIFQSSILSSGYSGEMVFGIYNSRDQAFLIEKGARFATAMFMLVHGEVNKYQGQWNGGRVSQPNSEKQI